MARPQARELAEREGLAGIDASLAELIAKAGLRRARRRRRPRRSRERAAASTRRRLAPGACRATRIARPIVLRADRRLPARDLAGHAAALQVRADLLALCGRGDPASTAYLGAWCSRGGACSGATRGATADTIRSRPSGCSGPVRRRRLSGRRRRRPAEPQPHSSAQPPAVQQTPRPTSACQSSPTSSRTRSRR